VDVIPTGSVEIPEIPVTKEVRLPSGATAMIVVDMQNDFVKPQGSLLVPSAAGTVGHIQSLLSGARSAGVQVAFTQDTHGEGDREWSIWPEHCRKGSWGWKIIDELTPESSELVCEKNRYDGFYGTWLEHYLCNVWNVRHLVVVGTVANICVLHTAGSAGLRWYDLAVPADGISALTPFDQALALRQVTALYAGKVLRSVNDIQFVKH
jgi:nicotinamidase-related amidase